MTAPLSPQKANETLAAEGTLPVLPLQFVPVKAYTTFDAEFAVTEGDLVFHFFIPEDMQRHAGLEQYWMQRFPEALDRIAREFFAAEFPRLKAAYTHEQASWWMRAAGFGLRLDPHALSQNFLARLDAALDPSATKTST